MLTYYAPYSALPRISWCVISVLSCLGIALAFAAGVMLYVSFIEIFVKSLGSFEAYFDNEENVDTSSVAVADYEAPSDAYHCATASLFLGMFITWMLDKLIYKLKGEQTLNSGAATVPSSPVNSKPTVRIPDDGEQVDAMAKSGVSRSEHLRTDDLVEGMARSSSYHELMSENGATLLSADTNASGTAMLEKGPETDKVPADTSAVSDNENSRLNKKDSDGHSNKDLIKMALITGLAIALHNFPEGFATFIATVQDKNTGAAIAIAIGVHNIPEGICVASPIYFATGNKWKAFMWGTLSGVAEPIAGAIGWIILSQRDTDLGHFTYAILFGIVTGMMAYISFSELIPTALRYDPDRKYFMCALTSGMVVMAISLMIFVSA